jgi:hypothetical protein
MRGGILIQNSQIISMISGEASRTIVCSTFSSALQFSDFSRSSALLILAYQLLELGVSKERCGVVVLSRAGVYRRRPVVTVPPIRPETVTVLTELRLIALWYCTERCGQPASISERQKRAARYRKRETTIRKRDPWRGQSTRAAISTSTCHRNSGCSSSGKQRHSGENLSRVLAASSTP